jgi:transposase
MMTRDPEKFFAQPRSPTHRQYEALRAFFYEGQQAEEVARRCGYKLSAFYSLTRDFRHECTTREVEEKFFVAPTPGRRPEGRIAKSRELILTLRKKYLSVSDIKAVLDSQHLQIAEQQIYRIIHEDGFARLPRRTRRLRDETLARATIAAPKSHMLADEPEIFQTQHSIGVLCFLP